jgi:hypothetical protein
MAAPARTTTSTRSLPDFMASDSLAEVVAALLELGVNSYEAQASENGQSRIARATVQAGRRALVQIDEHFAQGGAE